MDQEVVGENPPDTYLGCVMTTWHEKESLIDALEYFFDCTVPDSDFAPNGCEWAFIISVGSSCWDEAVKLITGGNDLLRENSSSDISELEGRGFWKN